jgi:hypothetical protein
MNCHGLSGNKLAQQEDKLLVSTTAVLVLFGGQQGHQLTQEHKQVLTAHHCFDLSLAPVHTLVKPRSCCALYCTVVLLCCQLAVHGWLIGRWEPPLLSVTSSITAPQHLPVQRPYSSLRALLPLGHLLVGEKCV